MEHNNNLDDLEANLELRVACYESLYNPTSQFRSAAKLIDRFWLSILMNNDHCLGPSDSESCQRAYGESKNFGWHIGELIKIEYVLYPGLQLHRQIARWNGSAIRSASTMYARRNRVERHRPTYGACDCLLAMAFGFFCETTDNNKPPLPSSGKSGCSSYLKESRHSGHLPSEQKFQVRH